MNPHGLDDPLRRFEREHVEALAALERLEGAVQSLKRGENPSGHLGAAREVQSFLRTAVREHNENEERALFVCLGEDAPLAPFEQEHRELRVLERRLAAALDGRNPTQEVPPVAAELIDLLRAHIAREDEVLFPMARALLGPEGLARVARRLAD